MAESASCQVLLTGLAVMADIGALEREKGVLQPLIVSVVATIAPPATDDLASTIDYVAIRGFAQALATERTVLIETYASRLAGQCLAAPGVLAAEVRVDKPNALADGLAGTVVRLRKGDEGATDWTG